MTYWDGKPSDAADAGDLSLHQIGQFFSHRHPNRTARHADLVDGADSRTAEQVA